MLLLYAIAAGLVIGRLAGGRLDGLTAVRFRLMPVALGGLLFQLVLFSAPVTERIGDLGPVLYVLSTLAVFVALVANLRLPGMWIIAVGAGMNLVAIVANGGYMPSSPEAWMQLNGSPTLPVDDYSNSRLIGPGTPFPALGDIFVLPRPIPLANVFSLGDALIALGAIAFLVRQIRSGATSTGHPATPVRPTAG
jgi:hypothetical protein